MPRRPRLSLPNLLMDAAEGYALWDADSELVDYNPAFLQLCGLNQAPQEPVDFISSSSRKIDPGFTPPQSAYYGQSISSIVHPAADASTGLHFLAWPIHGPDCSVQAVLGRLTKQNASDLECNHDPSHLWGLKLQDELIKRRLSQQPLGLESLAGFGPSHERLLRQVKAAIAAGCHVTIVGEPGTGRHHVARLIHSQWQARKHERLSLIPLDPTSLPVEILARDFLGVEQGINQRAATLPAWRVAPGATVLIEEISSLDPQMQSWISQAEEKVRLIVLARSAEEIQALAPEFKSMIDTLVLEIKPLRYRVAELPLFAQAILNRIQEGSGRRVDGFTAAALERLQMYDWPGNWRELERVIRLCRDAASGPLVTADDIPASIQGAYGGAWMTPAHEPPKDRLEEALGQTRRQAVEQALRQFPENKAAAARSLGISRPKLYRLMAELGLD